jgi:hypothetical protein
MVIEIFHKANTYVDESIRRDRGTGQWFCAVTAYVATLEAWIQAEKEWQGVLDHFGVSEFHLTDFLGRYQEFKNDWSDAKRDQFMERFLHNRGAATNVRSRVRDHSARLGNRPVWLVEHGVERPLLLLRLWHAQPDKNEGFK